MRALSLFAVALCATGVLGSPSPARAEDKLVVCHAGLITLASFAQHIKNLRALKRYEPEEIDALVKRERDNGPGFLSAQVLVQEEVSGSGTYDLRTFHGLADARSYRNVTAWNCERDDYPIVYFVGFRVREVKDGAIWVSRESDIVNVVALKTLDPKLDRGLKVKLFKADEVLCDDIGKGCNNSIWYERQ